MSTNPQNHPTHLAREYAGRLLPSTSTIAIYYYYSARKRILIFGSSINDVTLEGEGGSSD